LFSLNTFALSTAFTAANVSIGWWNTARVTTMQGVFAATAFNQDIGSWNTARLTTMRHMVVTLAVFHVPMSWLKGVA
jgi:hypothetical protein